MPSVDRCERARTRHADECPNETSSEPSPEEAARASLDAERANAREAEARRDVYISEPPPGPVRLPQADAVTIRG